MYDKSIIIFLEIYPQGKTFCGFFVCGFMGNAYQSRGRHKWYLKCHLIFVCKYRKRLLEGTMQDTIKEIFSIIELRSDFKHQHNGDRQGPYPSAYFLSPEHRRHIYSTREVSKRYPDWLHRHFWKEHIF